MLEWLFRRELSVCRFIHFSDFFAYPLQSPFVCLLLVPLVSVSADTLLLVPVYFRVFHQTLYTIHKTITYNNVFSVGKTSLMNRYSTGTFTGQYKATIGADCLSKQVVVTDAFGIAHAVTLQLWDTAGQERFQSLGVGFYRGADAAMLVYDITDAASLEHLDHWQREFQNQLGGGGGGMAMTFPDSGGSSIGSAPPFPFVVLGNKVDKDRDRRIPRSAADEWCARAAGNSSAFTMSYGGGYGGFAATPLTHLETSAKTAVNVEEAFQELARLALHYEDYKRRSQPQLFIPPSTLPIDLRRDDSHLNNYNDERRRQQGGGSGESCC